jgi:hypothetical protein
MATIFLSYRRTDGAQACRVREWLVRRLGADAVFMDVENIPFAVSFPDYIKTEIESAKLVLALIGTNWSERITRPDDQVRPEIEIAMANNVPVLPILIGNTPMPNPEQLPASIANLARQNAPTVGILNDFDTHMRALMPKIETILGSLTRDSVVTSNPDILNFACAGIMRFLEETYYRPAVLLPMWKVIGTDFYGQNNLGNLVGLYLHRVLRLPESLELHLILSIWTQGVSQEQSIAGWVIRQFEQSPIIPDEYFSAELEGLDLQLKIRRSDEDPRVIWKMITDEPLRLSLAYVATVNQKLT